MFAQVLQIRSSDLHPQLQLSLSALRSSNNLVSHKSTFTVCSSLYICTLDACMAHMVPDWVQKVKKTCRKEVSLKII